MRVLSRESSSQLQVAASRWRMETHQKRGQYAEQLMKRSKAEPNSLKTAGVLKIQTGIACRRLVPPWLERWVGSETAFLLARREDMVSCLQLSTRHIMTLVLLLVGSGRRKRDEEKALPCRLLPRLDIHPCRHLSLCFSILLRTLSPILQSQSMV